MTRWDDDSEFTTVTPGKYLLHIIEATEGRAKTSGKPVMNLTTRIIGGEFDGVGVTCSLPKWKVCILAKAIGLERKTDSDGTGYYDADGRDFEGKRVSVTINNREHKEKLYNDVRDDFTIESDDDVPF